MQNPDMSSLNRNCPTCHEGKVRLEVETPCAIEKRSCAHCDYWVDLKCLNGYKRYRPMTKQEMEELQANPFIGDALIDLVKRDIVTYKGQRVRVGR